MKSVNKFTEKLITQLYTYKQNFESKLKPLKDFHEIFEDFIKCQKSYSNELKKLTEKLFKKKEENNKAFSEIFSIFGEMFLTYQNNMDHTIEVINQVVIEQMKTTINDSADEEEKNFKIMGENVGKYSNCGELAKKGKELYITQLKKIEGDIINQITNKEIDGDNLEDDILGVGLGSSISLGRNAKKKYQQAIKDSNAARAVLLSKTQETVDFYKKINKKMIDTLVGMGRVFCSYLHKKVKVEDGIFTKSNNKMTSVKPESIDQTTTDYGIKFPDELTFEPYQIGVLEGSTLDYSIKHCKFYNQTIYDAVIKMKENFPDLAPDFDPIIEKKKVWMLKICDQILNNIDIFTGTKPENREKERKKILSLFDKQECRRHFLTYLNYKRAEGKFQIKKASFVTLGDIMKHLVKIIEKEKDFETLRYCLILSQTFFFVNTKGEKFYVIRYFDKHPLFQTKEFWDFYFSMAIEEAIEKLKSQEKPGDKEEDKERQKNNMIFSKILSTSHNMMEFMIPKEKITEYIKSFSEKYKISQEVEDNIIMMIQEIKYEDKKEFDEVNDIVEEEDPKEIEKKKKKKEKDEFNSNIDSLF